MQNSKIEKRAWMYDLLFILVLLLAGYLRLSGVKWGEGYHQHPDELAMMGWLDNLRAHTCIDMSIPVEACPPEQQRWLTLGEYFDSSTSTLNPYNRGTSFFPYGNLPMTIVRVALEFSHNEDIGNSKFFARQFSALADLFTIVLLYLIVSKLYGQGVGLIAAAFSSLAVMQIQQSHFFTSDLFANVFMFLALYFAVGIVSYKKLGIRNQEVGELEDRPNPKSLVTISLRSPLFWLSIGFGIALGMAMASKINAAALAFALPGAFAVRYLTVDRGRQNGKEVTVNGQRSTVSDYWLLITLFLIAGGLATIVSFRIFQPYAFDGLGLNPQWVANISEQRLQATGEADLPWNLQWARRTHLYSFANLTVWGLGLPLGILAWAGFLFMGWRILKGEYRHLLLWGWTAFYFGWQSMQFNPTMRYQLPVYPLLAMMAAWVVFEFRIQNSKFRILNYALGMAGAIVLALTAIWAFAFQSIYLRDETRMAASRWIYENVPGPINLQMQTEDGSTYNQPLTFPTGGYVQAGVPYSTIIVPNRDGLLTGMTFAHALETSASPVTILLSLAAENDPGNILAGASAVLDSTASNDPRGSSLTFVFDKPFAVTAGLPIAMNIETLGETLTLSGASFANETDYDWGLPFRVDGYDPFGGMYRGDLNLQVYWDDNTDKLTRFMDTLNQADYIFIPTNHQYAQITRLPERYPLTTKYYRDLLGCPDSEDIIKCYRTAQPGQYQGDLGFELAAVFESYPALGPLVINDQAAEEAFTFYDHPKVLIFKKTADYDAAKVFARLSSVDLTNVVHLIPKQAADYKDLMLPDTRLAQQRAGGTWSQLFNYDWIQNKYPFVGVVVWYAFIFILGLAAYPLARLALPALGQYAYPLGRILGLVLLAWVSWMGGSVGVPFTRVTISVVAVFIAAAGIGLWMIRREQFKAEWNSNRRFFVAVEILFLVFFLIDLLIRLGNPDLWHPAKGGERPMDFSYFNAVLKSESFPPYDPWFAGGYINYYYYGFVLAGTPVKLLGIVPSIAYNLILPTWFALIAVGAFAVGWNLVDNGRQTVDDNGQPSTVDGRLVSGLAASFLTLLLGNLGTVKLIFNTLQRIAAPDQIVPADAHILQKWGLAIKGLFMSFGGMQLPIGRGDWYWFPSRVIPAPGDVEPITEFPLFTFLYSDMHAHMLVMPITLFIIAWAVSFIKSRAQMSRAEWFAAFGIGALMVGALKPTNTWDLYTYFPLAALAVAYTLYRNFEWKGRFNLPHRFGNALAALGAVILLYVLGALLYSPFTYWYSLGYGAVDPWQGSHTPMSSYLTQWGLFLFIIAAWLVWETREWMASTPVSHLDGLRKYSLLIEIGLAVVIALLAYFAVEGVRVGWLALPLAAWAGILLLRPGMSDVKRGVLMMIGTALVLTLAVEVVVLVGDIGRMNTVFKLYLQAWMLLAVSAAAAFGWLLNVVPFWRMRWRTIYQVGIYVLVIGSLLFTLTATSDKINDRMTLSAPRTLDSMEFMKDSAYADYGRDFSLNEDYYLIRWMQENIQGSPVIVEAASAGEQYRWHSRITTYTGLPDVVGWQWHQQQQRVLESNQIIQHGIEVDAFYRTPDKDAAAGFLRRYNVSYIILGQLEYAKYTSLDPAVPDGLLKFNELNGILWREIFRHGDTILYEVLP
ncbi:MAG: glycosyltransferase family 39 protein [Chloroflexi bacterium]|nr:glycosyltransferase family 39 protein [Chloroflexota bacterium]